MQKAVPFKLQSSTLLIINFHLNVEHIVGLDRMVHKQLYLHVVQMASDVLILAPVVLYGGI